MVIPSVSLADTNTNLTRSLQEQLLNLLIAEVQSLEQQLNALQSINTTSTTASSANITVTVPVITSNPIVVNITTSTYTSSLQPQNLGSVLTPTCSINVIPDSTQSAEVSWTSLNTANNSGQIYVWEYKGNGDQPQLHIAIPTVGTGERNGTVQNASGSIQELIFPAGMNFFYPDNSIDQDNSTNVELRIGGAICNDVVPSLAQ